MAKDIPYNILNDPAWRQLPPGAQRCWYISENALPKYGSMPILSPDTSEYFRLTKSDGYAFQGHLGRIRERDTYFIRHQRGLAYFDDFDACRKGYFAFDQATLWRLESILPASPLIFLLKKVNLNTMEDYKQAHSISITGDGNVVAAGTGNHVNVGQIIVKGNLDFLKEQLVRAKVPAENISEITDIVQQEKPGLDGELPAKSQSWMNKMVGKAAGGAWDIVAHTAGHLLAGIIKAYYGLPG